MPRFVWKMEIEPGPFESAGDHIGVTLVDRNRTTDAIEIEVWDSIPGESAAVQISSREAKELIAVLHRAVIAVEGGNE